jgi:hypothetical protein
MCDGVVLDYTHFIFGGSLIRYNENGSTNNVKVMNHVDMLLWAMDHPPPTKMHIQTTKNIVLLTTPFLKNVATSSTNEEEEK